MVYLSAKHGILNIFWLLIPSRPRFQHFENVSIFLIRWYTVRVKDFCCNKICRCLWNQKSLSEQHVSMTPGKLKAHKYFGQGNKFQGSFKVLAGQHEQKSMGLQVPLSILPRLLVLHVRIMKDFQDQMFTS